MSIGGLDPLYPYLECNLLKVGSPNPGEGGRDGGLGVLVVQLD